MERGGEGRGRGLVLVLLGVMEEEEEEEEGIQVLQALQNTPVNATHVIR